MNNETEIITISGRANDAPPFVGISYWWKEAHRIAVILYMVAALAGCNSDSNQLIKKEIFESINKDEIIKVSDLLGFEVEYVCVLTDYQNRLNEREVEKEQHIKINSFLSKINFRNDGIDIFDDFLGSVVLIKTKDKEEIQMSKFEAYAIRPALLPKNTDIKFKKKFIIKPCVNGRQAVFTKISIKNKDYIVFGEIK